MGEGASRAFAEWQRETTLPESGSYSMGLARVKGGLRVLSVSRQPVRRDQAEHAANTLGRFLASGITG